MKNLVIVLIVAVISILNVACTDSKPSQATPVASVASVDTTKMFNDAIANKDSKVALNAIELDAENDGEAIYKCKKATITTMAKFINSNDYVIKYEQLNTICVFNTMK